LHKPARFFVNLISTASLLVLILVSIFANTTILELNNSNFSSYAYSACNCVIFAMDDIEDYGVNNVQIAVMDYFISKNLPFTASIIVSKLANSSNLGVFHKVEEGVNKGLFEPVIHGYRHINHTLLSRQEQDSDFSKAKGKLEYLFGKTVNVFIPPYNNFNLHTIEALSDLNISIISSSPDEEQKTFNPYKLKTLVTTNDSNLQVSKVSDKKPLVYHAPYTLSFYAFHRERQLFGDALVQEVLRQINESIANYGYAQVRLHPFDFAQVKLNSSALPQGPDPSRGPFDNKLDEKRFQELTKIVDNLLERNIRIASFKDILPASPSSKPSL
jgi:peptidoglycan/xylan/chitin deacetylase (PgdA/CDA1 family)